MDNHILRTRVTQLRAIVAVTGRRTARMLQPYLKGTGSFLLPFILRTLLPVAITAFAGYVEAQAKKEDLFSLLENYREYILEVEGRGEIPPSPCPMEETQ